MGAAGGGSVAYEKIQNYNGGFVRLALDWRGDWLDCLYRLYSYKMDKLNISALHIRKSLRRIAAVGREWRN